MSNINPKHKRRSFGTNKASNCVDKSCILVGMYRKVGIPAQYVHKKVQLNSGKTLGHLGVCIY